MPSLDYFWVRHVSLLFQVYEREPREATQATDETGKFCHRIHFFASPESAKQWMADRPDMFAVTVDEAFQLGRLTNRLRLGTAIDRIGSSSTPS